MILTQKQLDSSQAWKAYKALLAKVRVSGSIPALKKMQEQSEALDDQVKELFQAEPDLGGELVRFKNGGIQARINMLRPKPGRRPKPDFEREAIDMWEGIGRMFKMVDAFRSLSLQDPLMDSLWDGIPKSISAERQKLRSLRKNRDMRKPDAETAVKADLDSIESGMRAIELRLDEWYEKEVKAGRKPAKTKPGQSDLDKSKTWERYVEIHNTTQRAKTLDELDLIPPQPDALKDSLKAFFNDSALASDLMEWARMESGKKRKALSRTKAKSDAEKWNEVLSEYAELQTQFRIVTAFRTKGLDEPLTRTMATPLPIRLRNLIGSAKSVVDFAKTKPADPADYKARIAEMEAFEKPVLKAYKAWNQAGKQGGQ